MKRTYPRRLLPVILVALILSIFSAALTGCADNVVTEVANPGFEESDTGFAGWLIYDYQNDYNDNDEYSEYHIEKGSDGNCAVIESFMPNDVRLYQEISVSKNSYYRICADIKTEDVEEGAGVIISAIGITEQSDSIYGTNDWQTVEVYIKTTGKQNTLELSIGLGGYSADAMGKLYVDNVKVEKVSSVPSGYTVHTFFKETESAKIDPGKNDTNTTLLKLLFWALLIALIVTVVILGLKADKDEMSGLKKKDQKRSLDKTDLIVIIVLTVACAAVSFFRLGDTDTANSYWKSGSAGEYVIGEFDEVKNITGMAHMSNVPSTGAYSVYYERTDGAGDYVLAYTITNSTKSETEYEKPQGSFFCWEISKKVDFTTRRVKVVCERAGWGINEIGFLVKNAEGEYECAPVTVIDESYAPSSATHPSMVFDEQKKVKTERSYMNSTYFDEIYHVRTAYEMLNGWSIMEWTHPPLGKIIIGWGISIFGMNPFGWRFMGTFFGVLFVPVLYLFASKLFKKREYAILAAAVIGFDFMRLSQTRLATIDSYSSFFVLLMYFFMYDYFITKSYDPKDIRSRIPLALCGITFGIGAATKWTCLYAGAGLAILFFAAQLFEANEVRKGAGAPLKDLKEWALKKFIPTCLGCVVFFVLIPGTIYTLSYLPYLPSHPNETLWQVMINNQVNMYNYHSNLEATHGFSSAWWSWPLDLRPIWIFSETASNGMRSTIASFGNPAVWLLSIPALVGTIYYMIKKKDKKMLVVLTAFALQFIPWILVTRIAFIYHYMPCVAFVVLMIVYCFDNLIEDRALPKFSIWIYLAICGILFILFFPVTSGLPAADGYIKALRWFSSWSF